METADSRFVESSPSCAGESGFRGNAGARVCDFEADLARCERHVEHVILMSRTLAMHMAGRRGIGRSCAESFTTLAGL